ncbi:MAG: dihydropteroate synthase [Acidobacteria bacterium]|nr:dihydropteroate synthase [Acidobacteriota bacterium]
MPHQRPRLTWKIREGELPLGARTIVIGCVDLSAQSWPVKPDPDACLRHAQRHLEAGAEIVDVSALPGPPVSVRMSADEELRRLVPTLRKLRSGLDAPVCVTTYNAETAERVLELEASIIHDPTGLALDPPMGRVINATDAGVILGHAPGPPEMWNRARPVARFMDSLLHELDSAVARARQAGLERRRVAVDPGLGRGKKASQSWEVLERLGDLRTLGQPVGISPSRLPFLTDSVKAPELEWTMAASVAVTLAVRGSAHFVRVREVEQLAAVVRAADRWSEALEEIDRDAEERARAGAPAQGRKR